jgi:hypothetical protein
MIGESAPLSNAEGLGNLIGSHDQRLSDLERAASRRVQGDVLYQDTRLVSVASAAAGDLFINDPNVYSIPTVSKITITGIYIKPNGGGSGYVLLYSNNQASPSGGGVIYDLSQGYTVVSAVWNGLAYTLVGVSAIITPGNNWTWALRIAMGTTTFFDYQYNLHIQRIVA